MRTKGRAAQLSTESRRGLGRHRSRDQKQTVGTAGTKVFPVDEAEQRPQRERNREWGCP